MYSRVRRIRPATAAPEAEAEYSWGFCPIYKRFRPKAYAHHIFDPKKRPTIYISVPSIPPKPHHIFPKKLYNLVFGAEIPNLQLFDRLHLFGVC